MSVFRWLNRGMVPAARYLNSSSKMLWQSFRKELKHTWPKGSTTNVREGFKEIAAVFAMLCMIMLLPRWHLKTMKEHLPASVLGWFLFSFGFICL